MRQLIKNTFLFNSIGQKSILIISSIVSIGFFGYALLIKQIFQPDLAHHIKIAHDMLDGKLKIAHPVFFVLIELLSGFSRNFKSEIFAGFIIFSISHIFKIWLSMILLKQIFKKEFNWFQFIIVLMAQIATSWTFFTDHYVIGNISPNYFHNGTLSLSMTFVLLLLIETFKYIEDDLNKRKYRMILYGLAIALIKPSFLFCWIPILPVYSWYQFGLNRKLLGFLQVSVFLAIVIILQSTILKNPTMDFKVVFNPFVFFGTNLNHVKIIIGSLLFPIVSYIMYMKNFNARSESLLFFLFFIQATILSFCFYDTIHGVISPNLTWQSSIIHYLLILFSIGVITSDLKKISPYKISIPLIALGLQFTSGILYIHMAGLIHSFFI